MEIYVSKKPWELVKYKRHRSIQGLRYRCLRKFYLLQLWNKMRRIISERKKAQWPELIAIRNSKCQYVFLHSLSLRAMSFQMAFWTIRHMAGTIFFNRQEGTAEKDLLILEVADRSSHGSLPNNFDSCILVRVSISRALETNWPRPTILSSCKAIR